MGLFTYTYQGAGRLVQNLALPNTANIVNTYDTVRRLTSTTLKNSSQQIRNYHGYLINPANQRTQQTRTDYSYVNYTYDNLGQLQSARGYTAGGTPISTEQLGYFYDTAWNLNRRTNNGVVTTFGVNNLNQLNSGPTGGYQYDGNGNLTADSGFTYAYDDENQLTSITSPNYLRTELVYDARGRLRQRREYYWSGYWVLSDTVNYIYDGNRAIETRGTSGTVIYTRGLDLSGSLEGAGGIGGLLARTSGGSHAYYHADSGGNVTAMINSSQVVVATYRYDSYGRTLSQSGSLAGANVYRFSSKECLANSGVYYFGYRFYAPNLQRWMNRDPIFEFGGLNLFSFVSNSPFDYVDILGLESQASIGFSGTLGGGYFGIPSPFVNGKTCVGMTSRGQIFVQVQAAGMIGIGAYAGVAVEGSISHSESETPAGVSESIEPRIEANIGWVDSVGTTIAYIPGYGGVSFPIPRVKLGVGYGLMAGLGCTKSVTIASPPLFKPTSCPYGRSLIYRNTPPPYVRVP